MSVIRLFVAATTLRFYSFIRSFVTSCLRLTGLPRIYNYLRYSSLKLIFSQTVSILLIISILTLQTPAQIVSQSGLLAAANEIGQDVRYSFLSRINPAAVTPAALEESVSGYGFLFSPLLAVVTGTVKIFKKKQEQTIAQVVILPGSESGMLTVMQGERINFTAIGVDRNGNPISGISFVWSITDTSRKLPTRALVNGVFNANAPGNYVVVAGVNGKQAQIAVTVNLNPAYAVKRALDKQELDRTSSEKKLVKALTDKGAIRVREISSKGAHNAQEERRLYEEEKQIKDKIKLLPVPPAVPGAPVNPGQVNPSRTLPTRGGPSADDGEDQDQTAETAAGDAKEAEPSAASMYRPADDQGWDGSNWYAADDPGNQIGNPPGESPDMAAGNGNFQLSAPVIALPGRGIDLNLSLSYNSRLWSKAGNTMSYDADRGNPAPGWSLGFGKMMYLGGGGCMMVDADGTRHGYTGSTNSYNYAYGSYYSYSNGFTGHTADGSFIDYGCSHTISSYGNYFSGSAALPNGMTVYYGSPTGSYDQAYPTQITDAQGNYITISYVNNQGPNIQTITDTMGRVVNFNYDGGGRLVSITAPRLDNSGTRTVVRLHCNQLSLNYAFNGLYADTPTNTPYVLDAIYYPGTQTGYWFGDFGGDPSYSSYGMLAKVMEMRGMNWSGSGNNDQGSISMGTMTKQANYNYPLGPDGSLTDAPTYTTLTEAWAGMDTAAAVTTYDSHPNATPRTVTVTQPNGTKSTQYSYNAPNQWNDGLIYQDETRDASNVLLSKSVVTWGQGSYDTSRPTHMEMTDERNQTTATDLIYGANYNQVVSKKEYDYSGALLRETRSDYENNSAYLNRHIFNLVKTNEVYDGAGNRVGKTDYEYDNNAVVNGTGSPNLKNTPGVIMHNYQSDPYTSQTQDGPNCINMQYWYEGCFTDGGIAGGEYYWDPYCNQHEFCSEYEQVSAYDPNTVFRGNVTKITSYADAAGASGAIANTKQYDETGNLVAESASCCDLKTYNFDQSTQYAYPVNAANGSSDPNSPIRNTIATVYDFNTGLVKSSTNPNGRTDITNYDAETLRPVQSISSTGARKDMWYGDSGMVMTETVYDAGNVRQSYQATWLNGIGKVTQTQLVTQNPPNDQNPANWILTNTKYTNMGQLWQATNPYTPGVSSQQWTTYSYDALGRTTQVQTPDGSVSQAFYNETTRPGSASAAPGETLRSRDPWGRERWTRTDALGRTVEVVEPDPNGNGSVLAANSLQTVYTYDAKDQLTQTNQGSQVRMFWYDSLGRLVRQKLAEANGSLTYNGQFVGGNSGGWSDVFAYDNRSNLIQRIDARGVKTNYDYTLNGSPDPLNRLHGVSYDKSGADPTYEIVDVAPTTISYMTTGDQDRVSTVQSWILTEENVYDSEGRIADYKMTLPSNQGNPLVTSYLYDSLNRVAEVRYPAAIGMAGAPRKIVTASFDAASRLSELKVDNQIQMSEINYDPLSQVTSLKTGAATGNADLEQFSYDQATGLLTNQKVIKQNSNTTLLDLSYSYDRGNSGGSQNGKTGQLTHIYNNLDHNKDRLFEYDTLGRLVVANGGLAAGATGILSNWFQHYQYDRYGNRTDVIKAGNTANQQAIPIDGLAAQSYDQASNRISTSGYQYDLAGNLIRGQDAQGNWQRFKYDVAGRIVNALDDNGQVKLSQIYGAGRQRLGSWEAAIATPITWYVWMGNNVIEEYTNWSFSQALSWKKSYIYAGGSLLSTFTNNGAGGENLEFQHPDTLGTRLVTNNSANTAFEQATLPFGTELTAETTGTTNRRFTSYDRAQDTKIDYAVNRSYSSAQGRFTQVDPLGMNAASLINPQSLNLYAYCGNDPINHTDPTGLFWGKLFKWIGKAVKFITVAAAITVAFISVVGIAGGIAAIGIAATAHTIGAVLSVIGSVAAATSSVLEMTGHSKLAGIFSIISAAATFGTSFLNEAGKTWKKFSEWTTKAVLGTISKGASLVSKVLTATGNKLAVKFSNLVASISGFFESGLDATGKWHKSSWDWFKFARGIGQQIASIAGASKVAKVFGYLELAEEVYGLKQDLQELNNRIHAPLPAINTVQDILIGVGILQAGQPGMLGNVKVGDGWAQLSSIGIHDWQVNRARYNVFKRVQDIINTIKK